MYIEVFNCVPLDCQTPTGCCSATFGRYRETANVALEDNMRSRGKAMMMTPITATIAVPKRPKWHFGGFRC